MKYLSVCSGIEAATVAWHPLGWQPWAFSEIEKFPSRVLEHHYPDVPNLGDMIKFQEWPDANIDLFVGGTPCQSFSVAGLRAGMADPRGNLALTYLAIADKYGPRWLLWENVPGVLSSNGGRDFGAILGALVQLGYGFAYRVLDAQYFGVPQQRRRVFVVGYFGDWRPAAEVLFEPSCISWFCEQVEAYKSLSPKTYPRFLGGISRTVTTKYQTGSPNRAGHEWENVWWGRGGNEWPRRYLPIELERLQGFPDDYTAIPGAADGPRCKALGNSMAAPVMRWIGERIERCERLMSEMRQAA